VRGFDKLEFQAVARNAGLCTPLTQPANADSLESFALPVVVKARLHWTPGSSHKRVKVAISWSREDALEQAARIRSIGAEPLFQEYVSGSVLHFVALCDEASKIISRVVHVATHLGVSESGQSARAQVIRADSKLERGVQAFLAEIEWFGLADLQFWMPDDGEPLLTDFNGRIYGALALPHAAGMRAVDTWTRLATGREAAAPLPVKIGVRYQALEGDLRRALSLAGTRRIRGVIDCATHSFSSCHPVLCWTDPLPTVGYLTRLATRLARRATRRRRADQVP
jgi:predicted ATP-grasp superfamily ATP-dependent carboligase